MKSHNDSEVTLKGKGTYLGFPSHGYTTATERVYSLNSCLQLPKGRKGLHLPVQLYKTVLCVINWNQYINADK
jgi:hypothetical protein